MSEFNIKNDKQIFTVLISVVLILGIWLFFAYRNFSDFKTTTAIAIEGYENKIKSLGSELEEKKLENTNLSEELDREQRKNRDFENQINEISGTVGGLEKLSKTDPELLEKYSKVYFLSENYIPSSITQLSSSITLNDGKEYWFHKQIVPFLEKMITAAKNKGINLKVVSGYRSFEEQIKVKSGHTIVYGVGTANQFSAEQGYSEHQLGTTVDLTTDELGINFERIEGTEAYNWLENNAYKYGFVLSYPKNNSYYIFEPWHWRFVGIDLAKNLYSTDKYFYDLPQRDIDKYLISFFDKS